MAKKPKTPKQFAAAIKKLKREITKLEKAKKAAAASKRKKKKKGARKR